MFGEPHHNPGLTTLGDDDDDPIKLSSGAPRGPVFNTTSMIDVIFILLIFFVSISSIRESRLQLDLPEASSEGMVQEQAGVNELTIEVTGEHQILVAGEVVDGAAQLGQAVERARAQDGELVVRIKGDREARHAEMMFVIGELSRAGVKRVEFVVTPDTGSR